MSDQPRQYTIIDSAELYAACRSTNHSEQVNAYEMLWRYLYRVALQVVYDQPDAEAFAQDCAQAALIRVHERLLECREPAAFRTWARRIVSHEAIDQLRRHKRLVPLTPENSDEPVMRLPAEKQASPEAAVLHNIGQVELGSLIRQAPISDRSRRVILGRYFSGIPDELLAQKESMSASQEVLPSHIQVTRSKNISKLRGWEPLQLFLQKSS